MTSLATLLSLPKISTAPRMCACLVTIDHGVTSQKQASKAQNSRPLLFVSAICRQLPRSCRQTSSAKAFARALSLTQRLLRKSCPRAAVCVRPRANGSPLRPTTALARIARGLDRAASKKDRGICRVPRRFGVAVRTRQRHRISRRPLKLQVFAMFDIAFFCWDVICLVRL